MCPIISGVLQWDSGIIPKDRKLTVDAIEEKKQIQLFSDRKTSLTYSAGLFITELWNALSPLKMLWNIHIKCYGMFI